MRIFTFLLVCFTSVYAFADGNFWRPTELPQQLRPLNYSQVISSSVSIRQFFPGETFPSKYYRTPCAGTVISRDGHVLTNRHCVDNCVAEHKANRMYKVAPDVSVISTDPQKILGRTCELLLNGQRAEGTIIAISPGRLVSSGYADHDPADPQRAVRYWRNVKTHLPEDFEFSSDYVVLQIKDHSLPTCSVAASLDPRDGKRLWAVGMPTATARKNLKNSDGRSQYVSFGPYCGTKRQDQDYLDLKMQKGIDNDFYKDLFEGLPFEDFVETVENATMLGRGNFYHSATTVSGNSGGGVFNEQGLLSAITVGTLRSPFLDSSLITSAMDCTSMALSIERIQELMTKQIGLEKTKEAFRCSN